MDRVVQARPVTWVASSRQDLKEFPEEVRRDIEIDLIRRRLAEAERLHKQRAH